MSATEETITSVTPGDDLRDDARSPGTTLAATFWPPVNGDRAAFVAANATVIGRVTLAAGSSVWYGAVVRGDVEAIAIGEFSNVQDGAILHGDPGKSTILEAFVTIGHGAVIHSATIGRGSLIGIKAVVLDGVTIGAGSIVGACALVTKDVPPRSLVVGVPAKVVRPVSEDEALDLIEHAKKYEKLARVHAGTGTDLGFEPPRAAPDAASSAASSTTP